jgi:hypothetical protein
MELPIREKSEHWMLAMEPSFHQRLGLDYVEGVFWYTKHVHYTLVWI